MNAPEIEGALARFDAAWLKRILTRVDQIRADHARDVAIASAEAARDAHNNAIDEVFEARNALVALIMPAEPDAEPTEPEASTDASYHPSANIADDEVVF